MRKQPPEHRLAIISPGWFQLPSGIWAPADRSPRQRLRLALDGDPQGAGPIAVLNQLPDSFEQMGVFVDEEALGLPVSSLDQLIAWIAQVNFEVGAIGIAKVAVWIDDLGFDADEHLEVAEAIFSSPELVKRIKEFLAPKDRAVVLSQQQVVAFERLLILHGRDADVSEPLRPEEGLLIERALLGMSALSSEDALRGVESQQRPEDWLPFLVQNGAFNANEPLLEAIGRVTDLLEIAQSPEARARRDFCDIDLWAREDTGFNLERQMSIGFAALASSGALAEGPPAPATGLLAQNWVDELAKKLGLPGRTVASEIRDLLSGDRSWFRAEFEELERQLELSGAAAASGYNRTPFERRPFLRLADGRLLLWLPKALASWITDGFYYRALDSAIRRNRRAHFTGFWGWIVERYARHLLEVAHPEPRREGAGRVHGELAYGPRRARINTPDVMLDFGTDVVFVEVCSGRLSLEARVAGDGSKIIDDVTKMVAKKARQLSDRLDDYVGGRFAVPGVDSAHVARIWPVIVTGPGLLMTEILWDALEARMAGALRQPRVQPLTVLDMADVEQLVGLIEAGWSVPALLERKTGAYRRLDWRRMVSEDPALPDTRAAHIIERWEGTARRIILGFGWDPEKMPSSRAA